jgi:DNA-binding transcriptional MerR regulator
VSSVKLKKNYSSREVASLTGLSARQLQWWDARKLLSPTVASRPTQAGGFTERRYSPIELYELLVLADLRRRGFSIAKIRALLDILKSRFGVRLYDAIGDGDKVTLLTDGRDIYAKTASGDFYNLLGEPNQPLLVLGKEDTLKALSARISRRRKKRKSKRVKQAKKTVASR